MELKFSRQILEKYHTSNSTKSVRSEPSCSVQTNRWTDRHDETNSRFLQFCEGTYKVLASSVPYTVPVLVLDNYNFFRNRIFLKAKLLRIIYCTYNSIPFQNTNSYKNAFMPTIF